MSDLLTVVKKKTADFLCTMVGQNGGVPILKGPMKHSTLPKASASENLAMVLGRYEPVVVSELLSAGPIGVAYDVGAHLGFMSLVLSKIVGETGRVFAFEPIPENRVAIERLIDMNRLHQVIQVNPFALGASNGTKRMLRRECSSMHQLDDAYQGKERDIYSTVDVQSCTLDSFIFERGNPSPQLIKIDVEGAEEPVLKGALRTLGVYEPTLVVEIHGYQNAMKTWELLQGTGYSWFHLGKGERQPTASEQEVCSYFSASSWTHHFLMTTSASPPPWTSARGKGDKP